MNTSNTTNTDNQLSLQAYSGFIGFIIVLIIGFIVLIRKYYHSLQPTHIFELSIIADVLAACLLSNAGLMALQRNFEGQHPFCIMSNFLGLSTT